MLKISPHLFKPINVKLLNQVWETGVFPKDWMKSIIVPLLKKGKTDDPDNYRGISLTNNFVNVSRVL